MLVVFLIKGTSVCVFMIMYVCVWVRVCVCEFGLNFLFFFNHPKTDREIYNLSVCHMEAVHKQTPTSENKAGPNRDDIRRRFSRGDACCVCIAVLGFARHHRGSVAKLPRSRERLDKTLRLQLVCWSQSQVDQPQTELWLKTVSV